MQSRRRSTVSCQSTGRDGGRCKSFWSKFTDHELTELDRQEIRESIRGFCEVLCQWEQRCGDRQKSQAKKVGDQPR